MIIRSCLGIRRYITIAERWIAAASLLTLLILTLLQIIARNLFDTGFPDMEVVQRHLVLFIAFFGAIIATDLNRHIKIDIASACLSAKFNNWLARPFSLLVAIVCGAMAYYSVIFWLDEYDFVLPTHQWTLYLLAVIPVGFGLLALHFLMLSITGPLEPDSHHGVPDQ